MFPLKIKKKCPLRQECYLDIKQIRIFVQLLYLYTVSFLRVTNLPIIQKQNRVSEK